MAAIPGSAAAAPLVTGAGCCCSPPRIDTAGLIFEKWVCGVVGRDARENKGLKADALDKESVNNQATKYRREFICLTEQVYRFWKDNAIFFMGLMGLMISTTAGGKMRNATTCVRDTRDDAT